MILWLMLFILNKGKKMTNTKKTFLTQYLFIWQSLVSWHMWMSCCVETMGLKKAGWVDYSGEQKPGQKTNNQCEHVFKLEQSHPSKDMHTNKQTIAVLKNLIILLEDSLNKKIFNLKYFYYSKYINIFFKKQPMLKNWNWIAKSFSFAILRIL